MKPKETLSKVKIENPTEIPKNKKESLVILKTKFKFQVEFWIFNVISTELKYLFLFNDF